MFSPMMSSQVSFFTCSSELIRKFAFLAAVVLGAGSLASGAIGTQKLPADKFVSDLTGYAKTFQELVGSPSPEKARAAISTHHKDLLVMNDEMIRYMDLHKGHSEYFASAYNTEVSDLQQAWTFLDEAVQHPDQCSLQLEAANRMAETDDGAKPDPHNVYAQTAKTLETLCEPKAPAKKSKK